MGAHTRWLAVTLLAALLGCGGSSANQAFDDWNPDDKRVASFAIVGAQAFSSATIADKLETPRKYNPLALRLDVDRIVSFYRERGYFGIRVLRTQIMETPAHKVVIRITIDEGQPTHVASVTLQGAPARPGEAAQLQKLTELERGEVFKHPDYLSAKDRLKSKLMDQGYAHAKVGGTVFVDREARKAAVELKLDTGPLTRFGEIRVKGLNRVPESAVLARVAFATGDVFDPARLAKTQQRLYGLGYFGSVRIDWEKQGRPEVTDVTIHVHEAARHEVGLGGGVQADQSFLAVHGRATYNVHSWLDPLLTLTLDARPGYAIITNNLTNNGFVGYVLGRLSRDDLLAPRVRARVESAYELNQYEAYATRGPRAGIAVQRPFLDDRLLLGGGWQFYYLTILPISSSIDAALGVVHPYRLGFYDQSAIWDQRDNALDPTKGFYAQLQLQEGGAAALGQFSYVEAEPEVRGYVPLSSRVTLASYVRVGFMAARGDAPLTQRFFGGGATGQRGFSYRRMSPQARTSGGTVVPVGGEGLIEGSIETRSQIFKISDSWLDLGLFLDYGDCTSTWGELSLGNLNYAIGAGLRYNTIAGPIRLDVGMRLNRLAPAGPDGLANPDPGQRFAFHFSLGEAF